MAHDSERFRRWWIVGAPTIAAVLILGSCASEDGGEGDRLTLTVAETAACAQQIVTGTVVGVVGGDDSDEVTVRAESWIKPNRGTPKVMFETPKGQSPATGDRVIVYVGDPGDTRIGPHNIGWVSGSLVKQRAQQAVRDMRSEQCPSNKRDVER